MTQRLTISKLTSCWNADKYSRLETAVYAVSWILIFISPIILQIYLRSGGSGPATGPVLDFGPLKGAYSSLLMFAVFFLINNAVLLPRLFLRKRYLWYLAAIAVCMFVIWELPSQPGHPNPNHGPHPVGGREEFGPPINMFRVSNVIVGLAITCANIAVKVYMQSLRRDDKMLVMKNEQMQTELRSLKYQINPHFLMNSLNNIQSLIDIDSDRARDAIQELSKLMRYLLYDAGGQIVSLADEIKFMRSFIGLMKMRYPDDVEINIDFPEVDESLQVPSLLFISFVENAFKHGIDYDSKSVVSVNMEVSDPAIRFRCVNTVIDRKTNAPKNHSGIGIENVMRRLKLIYGENYFLDIDKSGEYFKVNLEIPKHTPHDI